MTTQYRVIAPVVVVKTMGEHGWQYIHIQQGGKVPEDAGEDWISGHLHGGMIAPVNAPEPKAEPKAETKSEPQPLESPPPGSSRGRVTKET